jgi:hypothetical protein
MKNKWETVEKVKSITVANTAGPAGRIVNTDSQRVPPPYLHERNQKQIKTNDIGE